MSGSSSDTVSLLSKTFAQPEIGHDSLLHLRQSLDTFAEKHRDPEEAQSPKVQEELRKLYNDHVEADSPKLEAFMLSLTALEPYLRTTGDLQAWFEITISKIVDLQGNKRPLLQQTQDFVVTCVSFDKDDKDVEERSKTCKTLMSKLIDAYLKRTERLLKGDIISDVRSQNRAQQQLQAMLVEVGRRHPQELFQCLEGPLTKPSSRFHSLQLMCSWLKHQQAHLHVIGHTDVVDILLKCLMNDRSTVVVSVALQCLLTLLPHIPAIVSSELPRLFLIYSRCLCWEKFSTTSSKAQRDLVTDDRLVNGSDDEQEEPFTIDPGWQTVASVPDALESAAPELLAYFTYLYGLYPVNFMSYVRKPRKYLKQINFPGAEHFDLDQNIIRKRTEQFQRAHLLHPSFFNMTAEEEITDNRWLKAEPSEVVAECLGLYSGNPSIPLSPGPPPSGKLPALPDSPTMSTRPAPLSPIRLMSPNQDAEPPVSPTTLALAGSIESLTKASSALNSDATFLQRELLVMRNELNFERYLKQQHVVAIGQLKRERIKAVTVEAETSSLYNTNKRLQKKLDEANKFNEKLQKETQSRKTHARQSEDQLNAKIRNLRSGLADQAALETSLKKANGDIEILRELLSTSEARETRALERLEAQTEQVKEVEPLKASIAALKPDLQAYKDGELDAGDMRAENELLKRDLEMTKSMVEPRDQERERSKKDFQRKIADLESQLASSSLNGNSSSDQTQKALEESQAKVESTQRAWTETMQELQQLKLKYNDLIASNVSRANVDGPMPTQPVPFQTRHQQLWQGPPVGTTYGQVNGYGRTMPMAVNGHGASFPANRPLRQEAFEARLQQDYSPLSRSEGSSTYGGGVFLPGGWETTMTTGSLPGSYIGGDNYSMVSGSARSGERPRQTSSAFSTGSEGSSLKSRDKIIANSQVRVFERGGAQNIKMKPKDNGEGFEKTGKKGMSFFKGLNN